MTLQLPPPRSQPPAAFSTSSMFPNPARPLRIPPNAPPNAIRLRSPRVARSLPPRSSAPNHPSPMLLAPFARQITPGHPTWTISPRDSNKHPCTISATSHPHRLLAQACHPARPSQTAALRLRSPALAITALAPQAANALAIAMASPAVATESSSTAEAHNAATLMTAPHAAVSKTARARVNPRMRDPRGGFNRRPATLRSGQSRWSAAAADKLLEKKDMFIVVF